MKVMDQIRRRRDELGIDQQELARRVGCTAQAVRYWETGRSQPGKSTAAKLEQVLDFRIDWNDGWSSELKELSGQAKEDSIFFLTNLSVGDQIRKRRLQLGMTQQELAQQLDCPLHTLQGLEQKYGFPNDRLLAAVEKALNFKVERDLSVVAMPVQVRRPYKPTEEDLEWLVLLRKLSPPAREAVRNLLSVLVEAQDEVKAGDLEGKTDA